MKILISDAKRKLKILGEIIDFLQVEYPMEIDIVNKLDFDWIKLNDQLLNLSPEYDDMYLDTKTGEIS